MNIQEKIELFLNEFEKDIHKEYEDKIRIKAKNLHRNNPKSGHLHKALTKHIMLQDDSYRKDSTNFNNFFRGSGRKKSREVNMKDIQEKN